MLVLAIIFLFGNANIEAEEDIIIETNRYNNVLNNYNFGSHVFTFRDYDDIHYLIKDKETTDDHYLEDFYILEKIGRPLESPETAYNLKNKYYRVVDSGSTIIPISFCHPKFLFYVSKDPDSTHLITIKTDGSYEKDTIISLKVESQRNILDYLTRVITRYEFVLSDSLLISFNLDQEPRCYNFYRILPNNTFEQIHGIETTGRIYHSLDFSQILLEMFRKDLAKEQPYIKIAIYDIASDSLIEIGTGDPDNGYFNPRRRSINDYLFYVKYSDDKRELWGLDSNLNQHLVYTTPFEDSYIDEFEFNGDELQVWIVIRSGDRKGRWPVNIEMPKP